MSALADLDLGDILDDVVHQFSDPLAFFRELVQNSIDAGTSEVEVTIDHRLEKDQPIAVITVQDWGEGMTREIIEGKLLRLFCSGKDEDLTKIGRFGIGFVSIFGINPDQVVLDTGREGQFWRILFDADRSYELFERDEPIEGTRVQLFKPMSSDKFEAFQQDARAAIAKWCKHAEVPIIVEGSDIREPFEIDASLTTEFNAEGTRVVMGFADCDHPFTGYYNRGLTLKEGHHEKLPWVTYKIDSRYLEHTLTRDQLLEDRHLAQAREILRRLATEELPLRLIDKLESAAQAGQADECEGYYRYLARFLACRNPFLRAWRRREIFLTTEAEALNLQQVERLHRRGELCRTTYGALDLEAPPETPVLVGGEGLDRCLRRLVGSGAKVLDYHYLTLEALRTFQPSYARYLVDAVVELAREAGFFVGQILAVEAGPGLAVMRRHRAFSLPPSFPADKPLELRPEFMTMPHPASSTLGSGRIVLLNLSRPELVELCELAREEPEWAAYQVLESSFQLADDQILRLAATSRAHRLLEGHNE